MALSVSRWMRIAVALGLIVLLLLGGLLATQLISNIAIIWQDPASASPYLRFSAIAILLIFSGLGIAIIVWAAKSPVIKKDSRTLEDKLTYEELERDVEEAQLQAIDVDSVMAELDDLSERQKNRRLYVVFFGAVSSGKSSLIDALRNKKEQAIDIDVRAGSTRQVAHYEMELSETNIYLTDVPGLLDEQRELSQLAKDESLRAHAIFYVTDKEIGRDEYKEIERLQKMERPLVVVLNKTDWYTTKDIEDIVLRIKSMFVGVEVVTASSETHREVTLIDSDGNETLEKRVVSADIDNLLLQLDLFSNRLSQLAIMRDQSMIRLGKQKLDESLVKHRRKKSKKIINSSMKKAMIGAMAAVSPGTDILIQGFLGFKMVKQLCDLHKVSVSNIDIDQTIKIASEQAGAKFPLILALVGNIFKAFPGVGTVTGGLLHAVSYALIFEKMGFAVEQVINEEQRFDQEKIIEHFGDSLNENMASRAKQLAQLVWQHRKEQP